MNLSKILILFVISGFCFTSFSQDFSIGVKYGCGEGTYKQIKGSENVAFTKIHQYGLAFAYSPYYSKLSVESGVEIDKKELADYLTVPLGFRISVGKKIRPFIEGGGYYSFLMHDNSEIYIMKNDAGLRLGGGVQMALSRQWRFEIAAFKKVGFAGSLVEKKAMPGNLYTDEKSHISPVTIEASIKFRY